MRNHSWLLLVTAVFGFGLGSGCGVPEPGGESVADQIERDFGGPSGVMDFFERHNVANWHKVFRLRDPKTGRDYFADIAEEQLDYQLFCLTVAAVGLTLRQRRVYGAESPGDPAAVENPAEI